MLSDGVNRNPTTRRARAAAILGVLAAATLIAGIGDAAQRFARFSGSIFDPHNGTVPQVTVVLTHAQSQAKYEVKSDSSGRFEFAALPAGEYQLEAKYPGFMAFSATVAVGAEDVQKNLALQIGAVQETITVRSGQAAEAAESIERAPAAARRTEASCTPAATGGNIRPPRRLLDARPRYPQHLADAGIAGVVNLEARIGPDGSVADVQVLDAAHPDLGAAAVDAVRQWQFDSTLLNCVPVDVKMTVRTIFELEK